MAFEPNTSDLKESWLKTTTGQYLLTRQKELILDLVSPHAGERVLDIGCGTGVYLQIFRDKWCLVTGIDCSEEMLKTSRSQLGPDAELNLGNAENIPYSDDEFDVVTIINALETAANPQKVIAEAIRVSRGRVFIGFLNRHSFAGTRQRLKEIFGFPLSEKIRFFTTDEIKRMVGNLIDAPTFKWGSVIYFPSMVYDISTELEELIPHIKNPLGAFAGLAFDVKYTYRTAQNPLLESYDLKAEAPVTAPEAVRGMLKESRR
jgi:ubiquinone/menaquinone biosynthesis C-methylase UbiE